jgi:hypothetical protein
MATRERATRLQEIAEAFEEMATRRPRPKPLGRAGSVSSSSAVKATSGLSRRPRHDPRCIVAAVGREPQAGTTQISCSRRPLPPAAVGFKSRLGARSTQSRRPFRSTGNPAPSPAAGPDRPRRQNYEVGYESKKTGNSRSAVKKAVKKVG